MDVLQRLSLAEKAAISAQLDKSIAALSCSDAASSKSDSVPGSPEPEPVDLSQSRAWQDYMDSRRDFDSETDQYYLDWKREIHDLKKTENPQIPEAENEENEQKSDSEGFEDLPAEKKPEFVLAEQADLEASQQEEVAREREYKEILEMTEEKYVREWEVNQMQEEDDLSQLILLHFLEEKRLMEEKRRRRLEAEQRKSQEIKLKAQLAVIDSEKRQKKEENRVAEEAKKRESERIEAELAQELTYQTWERSKMQTEERLSQLIEAQFRKLQEDWETQEMNQEDDYSRNLSSFSQRKPTKTALKQRKVKEDVPKRKIECVFAEFHKRKSPVFDVKLTPLEWPKPFPVSVPVLLIEKPAPPESVPLSDALPYPLPVLSHELSVKCENLSYISGLSSFKNLLFLSLTMNQIPEIVNIPYQLQVLDLTFNKVTRLPTIDLPSLQDLTLDSNLLTSLEGCFSCRNLRFLSLENNQIASLKGVENFPLLQRLFLYRNVIPDQPESVFFGNPYITHLNLGRNLLKKVGFHSNLKVLKSLVLYENEISTVAPITSLLLQELWLNGNQLKKVDFLNVANALEIVRFEDNRIEEISQFQAWNLKKMNVSFNGIKELGVVLGVMESAPNLEVFELSDNPVCARIGSLDWALRLGLQSKLGFIKKINDSEVLSLNPSFSLQRNPTFSRLQYEWTISELWLRAISRGEVRAESLKSALRLTAQNLPILHLNGLISPTTEVSVLSLEQMSYQYKEHIYLLKKAASLIQAWWKLRVFQIKKLRGKYAAALDSIIRIQAWFRGCHIRKQTSIQRYPLEVIIRIQAWYRGCNLRKRLSAALEKAKFIDPELAEIEEMKLDDFSDFDFGLKVPETIDWQQFIQPIPQSRLPPIGSTPGHGETRPSWSKERPGTDAFSETKSVQSSVPILPSAQRNVKETLSEWGFQGEDVKRAFHHRLAKKKARKMKEKETTADERLMRFRRMCG